MALYDYTFVVSTDGGEWLEFDGGDLYWTVNVAPDPLRPISDTADYRRLLGQLLPLGPAWSVTGTLGALLEALASGFAGVDARCFDLFREVDPRTTAELLVEWERVAGLPEDCVTGPQTVEERRTALVARVTGTGGQSKRFFLELASRLGYTVTIDEFFSEAAAIAAGIPYTGDGWAYTWRVNAQANTVREFRVGSGAVGERLRTWGDEVLECVFNHLKPAHTIVLFGYS